MKPIKADLIMLFVTLSWGSSYLFMKIALQSMQEFNLIAIRFGIAFFVAGIFFFRRLRQSMNIALCKHAFILGMLLFAMFAALTIGMRTTSISNAGFLTSLTVVFVPLIGAVTGKEKISKKVAGSVLLAITGIAFLTLQIPLTIHAGDLWCIVGALFYAVHIVLASTWAKESDTLPLGILQLGVTALLGFSFSFLFETFSLPQTKVEWFAIFILSIFCSLGFVLQIIAQKYTSAARMGLIFSLEPVFAAIFGFIFAQEVLGVRGEIGAILVLLSNILTIGNMGKPKNRKRYRNDRLPYKKFSSS